MSDQRMVKLAELWERTSAKGNRYFSGYLGDRQLLMFRGPEITRDNGEVVQTSKLLVQERNPDRRPQQQHTTSDLPPGETRKYRNPRRDPRQEYAEELAVRFQPDGEIPFE